MFFGMKYDPDSDTIAPIAIAIVSPDWTGFKSALLRKGLMVFWFAIFYRWCKCDFLQGRFFMHSIPVSKNCRAKHHQTLTQSVLEGRRTILYIYKKILSLNGTPWRLVKSSWPLSIDFGVPGVGRLTDSVR